MNNEKLGMAPQMHAGGDARVVQDCHKVPKLSLGYPRKQGYPKVILDTKPNV